MSFKQIIWYPKFGVHLITLVLLMLKNRKIVINTVFFFFICKNIFYLYYTILYDRFYKNTVLMNFSIVIVSVTICYIYIY